MKNFPWRLVSEICCSADVTSGKLHLSIGISPFSIVLEESNGINIDSNVAMYHTYTTPQDLWGANVLI